MNTINDVRWQEWTDSFLAKPKQLMSREVSEMFMRIMLSARASPETDNFCTEQTLEDPDVPVPVKIGVKHAVRLGLHGTRGLIAFATYLSGGPGALVMYIHAFRRIQQRSSLELLSLEDVVMHNFGDGFLSEESLSEMWDAQKAQQGEKLPFGNYLDSVCNA